MPKEKPLELVRIPLSQIKPDPKNSKDHDVGLIIESFKRFGYVNPMVLNADDFLLAGHGRRKGLIAMQSDGEAPPKNIEAEGDEWIVPVGIGSKFNKREATAYRLVDNRSTEQGGYDEPQLLENLIELSKNGGLEATGYDLEDVDRLFQLLNPNLEEVTVSDEAKKLQRKWKTKSGQLWEIGRHRLLCGDSTSEEDVEGLMDGKADIVFTDPPFPNTSKILEKYIECAVEAFRISRMYCDGKMFWFWDNITEPPFNEIVNARHVWHKTNGWQAGHWEAINEYRGNNDRGESIVYPFSNVGREVLERKSVGNHPTPKPPALVFEILKEEKWHLVYDGFLGSGTTMVAAEQLNRTCFGIEIEPRYCAVTLERMSTMDLEPELISGA